MSEEYIEQAEKEISDSVEDSLSLEEFLPFAEENPVSVADSINYLLAAIEHYGTRTVVERGGEKERYCFFDDPFGDGEHAILGNTEELNDFVDELRRMASEEGENERITWFLGPTATGKSELKRCLINGIKGFSRTEEGAKYTLEWTLDGSSGYSGMTYNDSNIQTGREWYKSPVNINPISILPENTRQSFVEDIDEYLPGSLDVGTDLDPFSQEAMDILSKSSDGFEDIVSSEHLAVTRYYPEVGDGIGVLHTEDEGNVKQKLVGGWMQGAMEKFAKRGAKNPQAFSYDGVLSQGNGLISIVEDASHHSETLDRMINVCEEKTVKLDNKISMDIDTLIVIISNPDLESQIVQYSDEGNADPFRALRRRLDKYELGYLLTLSIESLLLRRLLTDEYELWDGDDDRMERVAEPIELYESELAPHTIEAACMYEIITRLECVDSNISSVNLALLLENGQVETAEGRHVEMSDFTEDFADITTNIGIPVTYTVDKIVDLAQSQEVVLPDEIIDELDAGLDNDPMFSSEEADHFSKMAFDVKDYIVDEQEEDVLEAMVGDIKVTEEDVREYIDGIYAWREDEEEEFDAYELREFEIRYLGAVEEEYDSQARPNRSVAEFREDIIAPINNYIWENRDEDFTAEDVPLSECPALRPLLEENDWDTVARVFPEADLSQWDSPPEKTQTEELKEKTIDRMEKMGYSEKSAEEVSAKIAETNVAVNEVL